MFEIKNIFKNIFSCLMVFMKNIFENYKKALFSMKQMQPKGENNKNTYI